MVGWGGAGTLPGLQGRVREGRVPYIAEEGLVAKVVAYLPGCRVGQGIPSTEQND